MIGEVSEDCNTALHNFRITMPMAVAIARKTEAPKMARFFSLFFIS